MRKRFEVWLSDYFWRPEALQAAYARKISALVEAKQLALATGERHVVIDRMARVGMNWKYLIWPDGTLLRWDLRPADTSQAAATPRPAPARE